MFSLLLTDFEFVLGTLLSGSTVAKMCLSGSFLMRQPPSTKQFNAALDKLIEMVEENLTKQVKYFPSWISAQSDCCWGVRGYNTPIGFVTMLELTTNKIIGVSYLINGGRKKNSSAKSWRVVVLR